MIVTAGPRLVRAEVPPPQAAGEGTRSADEARGAAQIDELQRAYQTSGNPELLFKLAEIYRQAGNATAAERTYEAYLRRAPRGPHHADAERQLRELETGRAAPAPPLGGAKPAPARGPSRAAGPAAPATPPPAAQPAPPAPLSPSATPANVPLPSEGLAPPPARQAAEAPSPSAAAGLALSTTATSPGPAPPLAAWVPWAAAGSTIALTAGAIVFGTMASSRYNQLRGSCGQTSEGCTAAQIDEVRSRAGTADVLWAAAGVMAAATGVIVYVNTREAGVSALWRF